METHFTFVFDVKDATNFFYCPALEYKFSIFSRSIVFHAAICLWQQFWISNIYIGLSQLNFLSPTLKKAISSYVLIRYCITVKQTENTRVKLQIYV